MIMIHAFIIQKSVIFFLGFLVNRRMHVFEA